MDDHRRDNASARASSRARASAPATKSKSRAKAAARLSSQGAVIIPFPIGLPISWRKPAPAEECGTILLYTGVQRERPG